MSRSTKKTPIMGMAGGAQKKFKQQEHRKERTSVSQQLKAGKPLPDEKQFGNEWYSPRDGKQWFGACEYRPATLEINWPAEYIKWMRK